MAGKTAVQQQNDPYDATKRQPDSIPPFVRVPTGEVEVESDGELVLDSDGNPILKSQAYLVRRTGAAIKEILKDEVAVNTRHVKEQEEEDEAFKVEDEGGDKVDLDWLNERRERRTTEQIDLTYRSLAKMLTHPADGSHPDPDNLSEVLDYVTAAEWLRVIAPPMQQVPDTPDPETGAARTKEESPTLGGSGTDPGAAS